MPRALWKGAITFGLVHVPVALYPASHSTGIDFDWLDARSMDPVGYKRINKRTGKEVPKEHIVRGVKHGGDGEYVVLGDDEIRDAYPRTTQTIAIQGFARADEIPFVYLDHPYYLEPVDRGQKVYALLRDALAKSGRIGIARLVIQTREHLAALVPDRRLLLLSTLRWGDEIRSADELDIPPAAAGTSDAELKMAMRLIDDMAQPFDPAAEQDRFRAAVMALVEKKADAGKTERVQPLEDAGDAAAPGNVVDLTELLKRSLRGKGNDAAPPAGRKAPRRRSG